MAAGARLNPRVRSLESLLELSKPAVEDAAIVADSEYRRQETSLFATEGSSGGERWTPLSDRYAKWKKRKFPGRKILTLTGVMRELFATTGSGHVMEVFRLSSWRIRLGAQGDNYIKYHAEGDPPLPKRDPQQRTPQQDQQLREAVRRGLLPHVMRAIRARLRAQIVLSGTDIGIGTGTL